MSLLTTALDWLTAPIARATKLSAEAPSLPPRASRMTHVSAETALSLSTVYRGIQIHATAGFQLSIRLEHEDTGTRVSTPSILDKPYTDMHRPAWIEYCINSLYVDGNAFWLVERFGEGTRRPGTVSNIIPLNPHDVTVQVDRLSNGTEQVSYHHRGKKVTGEIKHLKLLRIPGLHRGLGPIQAAQIELRGALDARDYGALWLSDSNVPDGILTTDQILGPGDTDKYKHVWYGRNPDGTAKTGTAKFGENERLRVMGQGLKYQPLLLKPSDVQFLETQQFTTTQVARLLGTPASLLLAAVEGNSQTYSNIEQDWIGYVRFSLMKPLLEIEEALTELMPRGTRARFNTDALLRTDTKTRYEAHNLALNRWKTLNEVRHLEGLPPIDGGDVLHPVSQNGIQQ